MPAKVEFWKRMSSLPLPKRERMKAKAAPTPNPAIVHLGIKGFIRSIAKGDAMERGHQRDCGTGLPAARQPCPRDLPALRPRDALPPE